MHHHNLEFVRNLRHEGWYLLHKSIDAALTSGLREQKTGYLSFVRELSVLNICYIRCTKDCVTYESRISTILLWLISSLRTPDTHPVSYTVPWQSVSNIVIRTFSRVVIASVAILLLTSVIRFSRSRLQAVTAAGCFMATCGKHQLYQIVKCLQNVRTFRKKFMVLQLFLYNSKHWPCSGSWLQRTSTLVSVSYRIAAAQIQLAPAP